MSRFAILLGGTLTLTPRLQKQGAGAPPTWPPRRKRQRPGARAIAADSGMAHAELLGLDVELWVGDFDSTSEELARRHVAIPRHTHPPAKNATDGELAVAQALERGAREIILVGAFGG